ncbi:MAG: exosortase/archaeosortase family protein [Gemmataceae bacterium]
MAALGVAVTAWAYWPVLRQMVERWATDPQFSHGWIVPIISAYLLWDRRAALSGSAVTPTWWGLPVTLAGLGMWAVGTVFYLTAVEAASLPLTLLGLVACWGGRAGVRWAWPGVGFLLFMAPLPYQVQTALGGQLRRLGTAATTYGLQTLGIPAVPEGNVIVLENGARLGVVEACSGLGMTMTFFALTAAAALLVRVEWWKRAAVVASAAPIAVAANVLRLIATGVVADHTPNKGTVDVMHDVAGWLMMPVAVGMIAAEFWVLNRVVVRRPVAG